MKLTCLNLVYFVRYCNKLKALFPPFIKVCFSWPCVVLGGWVITYNLQEQISAFPLEEFTIGVAMFYMVVWAYIWVSWYSSTIDHQFSFAQIMIVRLDGRHVQEFVELCLEIFECIEQKTIQSSRWLSFDNCFLKCVNPLLWNQCNILNSKLCCSCCVQAILHSFPWKSQGLWASMHYLTCPKELENLTNHLSL